MHAGSVATIPAGWARVTALDGKFLKATAVTTNPNVTGGATTHSHTSSAHSHTMNSHSHTVSLYHIGADGDDSDNSGSELTHAHGHDQAVAGLSGGALSSVTSTYASISNNPPFYEVIFITPSGATGDVEAGILSFWSVASVPTGWTFCDGSGGTPDLRNLFLRGAGTGAAAGTTGGSTTNVHTLTHSHSEANHLHSEDINASGGVDGGGHRGTSGSNYAALNHTHRYRLNNNTAGGITTPDLTTAETVEPAYKKLMVIKNTSGGISQPQSIIAMWLGTLATIPAGWTLCDGADSTPDMRDKFFKVCNTSGELNTTGGANTHTHASQNHLHTGSTHNHTSGMSDADRKHDISGFANGVGGGYSKLNKDHTHDSVTAVSSTAASWVNAATTADSSDNQPEFLTVAFIMFTGVPIAEDRDAQTTGQVADNDEMAAEVTGVDPSEERYCQVTGQENSNSERSCEISGLLVWDVGAKPTRPVWVVPDKLTT